MSLHEIQLFVINGAKFLSRYIIFLSLVEFLWNLYIYSTCFTRDEIKYYCI